MFEEFYYWAYKGQLKKNSDTYPELLAILVLLMLQSLNISTLSVTFMFLFKIHVNYYFDRNSQVILGLSIFIVFFLINFIVFYRNRHKIFSRIEQYTPDKLKRSKFFWRIYLYLTIIIFILVIVNLRN